MHPATARVRKSSQRADMGGMVAADDAYAAAVAGLRESFLFTLMRRKRVCVHALFSVLRVRDADAQVVQGSALAKEDGRRPAEQKLMPHHMSAGTAAGKSSVTGCSSACLQRER